MEIDREFSREVKELKPKKVLNIACGVHLKPDFLKDVRADFFGIDIDKRAVSRKVKYCDIDKQKIPYPNNHFDLVICIYSIEHFKTRRIFSEVRRVLKKSGKFVFVTTNAANPVFSLEKILRLRKYYYKYVVGFEQLYPAFYRTNTPNEIEEVLKRNGFEMNKILFFDSVKGYFKFIKISQIVGKIEKIVYPILPSLKPTIYVSATKVK